MPIDVAKAQAKLSEFAVAASPHYPSLHADEVRVLVVERVRSGYDFFGFVSTLAELAELPGVVSAESLRTKLRTIPGMTILGLYLDGEESFSEVLEMGIVGNRADA